MSMKTILIPTEQRTSMSSTLQTALLLARRFDSYIEGFALQPAVSELLAVDMGGSFAPKSFMQDRIEDAQKTKAIFESFMHEHGVPRSDPAISGLCFGWLDDAPDGEGTVGSYGRVFDLIVLNRPDPNSFGMDRRVLESGLFESGRPILLSPPAPPKQIATNVLIAWNGSTEQTRAIAFAMPLLQQAESVKVLTIPGGAGVPGLKAALVRLNVIRHALRQMRTGFASPRPDATVSTDARRPCAARSIRMRATSGSTSSRLIRAHSSPAMMTQVRVPATAGN